MTVPQERENDPFVLDTLGFVDPSTRESRADSAQPPHPFSPALEGAPALTRRELRDRERAADTAPAPRRGAATPRSRARAQPRRAPRNTARRDAVRTAGGEKTLGKRVLSFGAMLFAGALAFGLTVPANAFNVAPDEVLGESLEMDAQTIEVDPNLVSFSERDAWTVTSWAQMLKLRYGNRSFDYTVGSGPVRWPFPYPVTISSGFGDRAAPCYGCSTVHSGIDFTPGAGAAIFAIADGVVYEHGEGGTSWGNYVVIQHVIDGQTVYSGYAHMQSASSPMVVGEEVKVGDFVGLVGSTGQATGAHLHFSISLEESARYVDPYTYLKTHAS